MVAKLPLPPVLSLKPGEDNWQPGTHRKVGWERMAGPWTSVPTPGTEPGDVGSRPSLSEYGVLGMFLNCPGSNCQLPRTLARVYCPFRVQVGF